MKLLLIACLDSQDLEKNIVSMKNRFNETMDAAHQFEISNMRELINQNTRILFRIPQQLIHIDNYIFDYVGATVFLRSLPALNKTDSTKILLGLLLKIERRLENGLFQKISK